MTEWAMLLALVALIAWQQYWFDRERKETARQLRLLTEKLAGVSLEPKPVDEPVLRIPGDRGEWMIEQARRRRYDGEVE